MGRVRLPLYSTAVFNLNTLDLYSFASLSLLTFCRTKSYKKARHRQNKSQQPYAQELQATSFGRLLFAVHSFRSSIGGKWTRFSRNNNNTKMHRSNIICPFSDAWTAARCYFDSAVLFNITFANGKPRIKTVSQTVPVWFWNYTCRWTLNNKRWTLNSTLYTLN